MPPDASDLWPADYRCAALFTFDLDATESWRTRAERDDAWDTPPIQRRGRYGPEVAVPRIVETLDRYDVSATFFVPGKVAEQFPEAVHEIHEGGHELALHGYTHTNPARLPPEEEEAELVRAIEVFEDMVGETPIGYRSPAGDFSNHSFDILARNGVRYDSSLKDDDYPYPLDDEGRIVELPDTWYLDDFPYYGFNMYPQIAYQSGIEPDGAVFDTYRREFDGIYRRGRLFNLILHPQLVRSGRLDRLEELLQRALSTGDTWVTTARAVADHWHETTR
jgi:peptidoglycan/xylan/chitin deacetylase (PgdA/CDA1 family)